MKKILLSILILPIWGGCENWFDISPKSELKADDLFKTPHGFRDALMGCYGTMATEDLYGGQLTMTYMDVLGHYYSTASGTLNDFEYAFAYDYTHPEEEKRKNKIWKDGYNVIVNINSILERIDKQKAIFASGEFELFKGEALGLRAYLHLDILRMFAPSPAMENGNRRKAIPYVDHYTNRLFKQLTTQEVLERIIGDLTEARSLLAKTDPYGPEHGKYDPETLTGVRKGREFRMNYYAVTALLARTHIYRNEAEDRAKAFKHAVEVIESGLFPLVSGPELTSKEKNGFIRENIFSLEARNLKDRIVNKYFYSSNTGKYFLSLHKSQSDKIFPPSLNTDYRILWWMESSGSYNLITKYNYSERIPLLKVPEMYLIASETAPDPETASSYFNQLQYHRGLPDTELKPEEMADKILSEYAKEFIGEGQLFYACKRMGIRRIPFTKITLPEYENIYNLPLPAENTHFTE